MIDSDLAELYQVTTKRLNDKKVKEVFSILYILVNETKKKDEKIMGFIRL